MTRAAAGASGVALAPPSGIDLGVLEPCNLRGASPGGGSRCAYLGLLRGGDCLGTSESKADLPGTIGAVSGGRTPLGPLALRPFGATFVPT